jgi:hypothetical protein
MKANANSIIACIAIIYIIAIPAYAAPKIQVDHIVYDAGEVNQGRNLEHGFKIKNVGDEPLEVKAKSCCGTISKSPSAPIMPGMSDEIRVEIMTRTSSGHLRKEIGVTTNDPSHPMIDLIVTAGINETLRITPRSLDFGDVLKGSTRTMEISFENISSENMDIVLESFPKESLLVSPSSGTIKAEKSMKCVVRVVGRSEGHIEGSIYAKTGGPDYMAIPVLVQAEIKMVNNNGK